MSYSKTKKEAGNLVICEISSMKAEGLVFHSKYEAESIMRIQLEQTAQEMERCRRWTESLTDAVGMQRDIGLANYAEELQRQAEYLAVEAIRLAAVAGYFKEITRTGDAGEKKGENA